MTLTTRELRKKTSNAESWSESTTLWLEHVEFICELMKKRWFLRSPKTCTLDLFSASMKKKKTFFLFSLEEQLEIRCSETFVKTQSFLSVEFFPEVLISLYIISFMQTKSCEIFVMTYFHRCLFMNSKTEKKKRRKLLNTIC